MITKPPIPSPQLAQTRLKHLALLDLIATHGSLRRVAVQMHVTQPAVTAMLKELEETFGACLVSRDSQGASLTPRGEAVRQRLTIVLHELEAARLAGSEATSGNIVRVGIMPSALIGLASGVFARLRGQGGGLDVLLFERTVDAALSDLASGKLDCVISRVDSNVLAMHPKNSFELEPLWHDSMKVACRRGHVLAGGAHVAVGDLLGYPWAVLASDSQIRLAFDQAFVQQGRMPPIPVVESLSFVSNLHLVRDSDLLTIAPASVVDEFCRLGLVDQVPVSWPVQLSPLMFITRAGLAGVPGVDVLRSALRGCCVVNSASATTD